MRSEKRTSILPRLRYIMQNSLYLEMQALRHILDYRLISINFRPIKALPSGNNFAYQAVVRGPQGSNYELGNSLLAAASFYKCRREMETLYLQEAIASAVSSIGNKYLFLTIDPVFLSSREYDTSFLINCLNDYQLDPRQVVMLIGNPEDVSHLPFLQEHIAILRTAGLRLAIHDFGTGASEISIALLQPDFVIIPVADDGIGESIPFTVMSEACCQVRPPSIYAGSDLYLWGDGNFEKDSASDEKAGSALRLKTAKKATGTDSVPGLSPGFNRAV